MNLKNLPEIIAVIIVVVVLAFVVKSMMIDTNVKATQQTTQEGTQPKEVQGQEILLSWGKFNYDPEIIKVKAGMPITITADLNKLQGCFQSFVIPELGVQTYFSEQNNKVTFTPEKKGSFTFTCSMGMGRGTLIVE